MKQSGLYLMSLTLAGCGFDTDQFINIEMYGVYTSPTDAAGDTTPQSLEVELTSVALLNASGNEQTVLYSGDPVELTVVDRSQLIYQKDLADYQDSTFIQTIVTFNTSYIANVKDLDPVTDELSTGTVVSEDSFVVETGKSVTFSLKVSWQNTVLGTEVVTDPTFELVLE
ncbi:hypothetical protein [Pseudobacteriovorax antillogorgiicola]|uniref:Lipoprotein n=1 Tax=Pseudobacteriovorax antillogorgiicola TaxID=1513793 RepID=A0A1Y6CLR9_9BACT|nr:hypothetical protein [Pseudobacteriovorax antillogorgiicola]TCS45025.1 hypothetical protein EDD56_13062 [Pseudobacteriovorax antillogorgiicola]SMF76232.1 hypothetical protein SAMN06296036_13012 [Pseudobacteriovorax antillogorgiicola]